MFEKTFKALSAPVRRDILNLLKKGRMSAGDIAAQFDMTQATVSYHLSILKSADLVREEKDKNYITKLMRLCLKKCCCILSLF